MSYSNHFAREAVTMPQYSKQALSQFWLLVWASTLSVGWLLPNHYLPWPSFHLESWVAVVLVVVAAAILVRTRAETTLSGFALILAATVPMPFIQYFAGIQVSIGSVWTVTAYLVGFLLAVMVGARWESATRGQLADGLFWAIGIASILSVGLQLHQWFLLDRLFLWDMGNEGQRPFANLGQPNLLATLLLWGLLATAWGVQRRYLGRGVALLLVLYLLMGIALTGSRTAWMTVAMLIAATWYWRSLWPNYWVPWLANGLGIYFWVSVYAKEWLREFLLLGDIGDVIRIASETRPQVWAMFSDAVLRQPIAGYGWNQIALAHLAVADVHPPLYVLFSHAHNLFLDLVLSCGIPVGFLLCGALLWWHWRSFRAVTQAEDAVLFMVVLVIANHALLEYPLSYAYFLLPLGLIIGAIDIRLSAPTLRIGGRWVVVSGWALSALLLSLMIRDYWRVEASYYALRFELANFRTSGAKEPPDVFVLTQLRELIRYARFEPHHDMSNEDMKWMLNVVQLYPSAGNIHKLAAALAWNRRPQEAQSWLIRMCEIVNPAQCEAVRQAWVQQAVSDDAIRGVPWPKSDGKL